MRRVIRALFTCLLALAVLAPAASAGPKDYAAIAYSPVKKAIGIEYGASEEAAKSAAIKECQDKGGANLCLTYNWIYHGAASIALPKKYDNSTFPGVGTSWSTQQTATQLADTNKKYTLGLCKEEGGKDCKIVEQLVTDGLPLGDGYYAYGGWEGCSSYPCPETPWQYAALGDSYSAGKGNNPDYMEGPPEARYNVCGRSKTTYGNKLFDAVPPLGAFRLFACTGAVTDDLKSPVGGQVPQLMSLGLETNVRTVTLTMGGNDISFEGIARRCLMWKACRDDKKLGKQIDAAQERLGGGKAANVPKSNRPIHPITDVLKDIHSAAPNARIFIAGYPRPFSGNKARYRALGCYVGWSRWVEYDDARWLNRVVDHLNGAINKGVEAAKKDGVPVEFVSVRAAFTHHGLCDKNPWVYGLTVKPSQGIGFGSVTGSFHPNKDGQKKGYFKRFREAIGV